MDSVYYAGIPPFCDPSDNECYNTPGYEPVAASQCGNESCCLFGTKIACQFNMAAWKKSKTFALLVGEIGQTEADKIIPQFRWFGQGYDCDVQACDVFNASMIPVTTSQVGIGPVCTNNSYKWLGVGPILQKHKDLLAVGLRDCALQNVANQRTIQRAFDYGKELIDDLNWALAEYNKPVYIPGTSTGTFPLYENYKSAGMNISKSNSLWKIVYWILIVLFLSLIGYLIWRLYTRAI